MQDNPVIRRILDATGDTKIAQLAKRLGVKPQTVHAYTKRMTVPEVWLLKLQEKEKINSKYLQTGEGPIKITPTESHHETTERRKFESMIFSPNGNDRVLSTYPAAGIVTNASGLELPARHMVEHILCPDVRPTLSEDGGLILTGSGIALRDYLLECLRVRPEGARSLQTPDGLIVFDISDIVMEVGAAYIIAHQGFLSPMRLGLAETGAVFTPLFGSGDTLRVHVDQHGQTPRIIGRAVWIGRPL